LRPVFSLPSTIYLGNHSLDEKTHHLLTLSQDGVDYYLSGSTDKQFFITGRSRARSLRMMDFSTIAPMDIDSDSSADDMSLDDPMDWDDYSSLMDIDSESDDDMSVHDPMNVDDNNEFQDVFRAVICSFGNLLVSDPSFVDEHGRLVRRSLRLAAVDTSTPGSFLLPSEDGRYLRRSARLRR
jgi:hypothetical protein